MMKIHLLDVGQVKYGDCLLITRNGRSILIDGGHPGDTVRIGKQLEQLLAQNPPFKVDLLVVTHCHNDHVGCLPALVKKGDLDPKLAVVADEKLGFGRDANDSRPADALPLSDAQRGLLAALQEEDHSDLPPSELEEFLQDATTLEDKYIEMLGSLGNRVVRYGRATSAELQQVEHAFADFGLRFLGPTEEHLLICAEALSQGSDAIGQTLLRDAHGIDAQRDLATTYRRLASKLPGSADDAEFAADQPGPGAAKNDQSIVLKVSADGWTALLAGDMQFAKAEVTGLSPEMKKLRRAVVAAGPYDFVKLSHHSSYNGVDDSVMADYSHTALFAHTGGIRDPKHPDPDVLDLLKGMRNRLKFARTDHNGLITVSRSGGELRMEVERGRLNDFAANPDDDVARPPAARPPQPPQPPVAPPPAPAPAVREQHGQFVTVTARVPHVHTRVTLTIQVEPGQSPHDQAPGGADAPHSLRIGGGRRDQFPRLLFVTHTQRLGQNVDPVKTQQVLDAVRAQPNLRLLELPTSVASVEQAVQSVRSQLSADLAGVVLVGGYDVVPSYRLDVLDTALRQELAGAGQDRQDADNFVVWSDEPYGDRDGDWIAELPVSRVPDARVWDLLKGSLEAPRLTHGKRFGVHNINRPFATLVYPLVPGTAGIPLEVSEQFGPADVQGNAATGAVYYMLHGSARDGTRFWGEEAATGDVVEAMSLERVPSDAKGSVVFSGCCWGALTVSPIAVRAKPDTVIQPRVPEASIALAYLRAGALAFVGCTGSHYSPLRAPFNFFGRPMHEAFWRNVAAGQAPAQALFAAKSEFARDMPHGRVDPFSRAVELKTLRQFTCLGLGW